MGMSRKSLSLLGALAVAVMVAGCSSQPAPSSSSGGDDPATVVFLNPQPTNPFWQRVEAGLKKAAEDAGYTLQVLGSGSDVGGQVNVMQSAVASHPDGIIVGALDSVGIVPGVEAANAANIPVIAVDSAIEGGDIASLIQTDNVAAAALAGNYIAENIDPGAKVLLVDGDLATETANKRHDGAEQGLKEGGEFEIISQSGFWDTGKAMDVVQNALTANSDLAAIFNASDQMTAGTLAALGARKGVVVTGFDGDPTILEEIMAGRVAADVAQDPCTIGAESISQMKLVLAGDKPEKLVAVDAVLITADNVDEFLGKDGC